MSDTHIVRFKIVTIACQAMPEGQQYTVFYRRGETSRSTPCYVARKGVADFSAMPEGAAVIHFKSGHAGRRYAPKYIQMRVEEYTRGAPRRTVGELEVDCSLACTNNQNMGARLLQVTFRLYGVEAKMTIAFLVYPERAPPLSFDGLVTPSAEAGTKAEVPPSEVKVMGRGEAMTLLISLETMLERKRSEEATGKNSKALSRAEKRLRELEERRKMLTGTEGLATRVVAARCQDCVEAQFVALARRTRKNYVGATAAYLRQLALQSGVPLTGDDAAGEGMDEDTMREQLNRSNRRIDELKSQMRELEERQNALGRLQHKMDVSQELCANLDKVAAIDAQVKLLEKSREALTAAIRSRGDSASSPISREIREINVRVKTLSGEQEQLRAKVKHMTTIAAGHVLSWARAKNPPEPVVPQPNVDDLFDEADSSAAGGGRKKDLSDDQRKQILTAFQSLRTTAPPATGRSASASSSSGHRTPRDVFGGAPGLPTMSDFTDKPNTKEKPQHQDPLKPAGLRAGMFAETAQASTSSRPPAGQGRTEFAFGSPAGGHNTAPAQEPVFDFAAIMRQAEDALGGTGTGGGSAVGGGGSGGAGGGFSLEPAGASLFSAQPATRPAVTFGAVDDTPSFTVGSAPQRPAAPTAPAASPAKVDDPYYDDIDDYTVPPDVAIGGPATVEFDADFNFALGAAEGAAAPTPPASSGPLGGRPTFNFGPADSDDAGAAGGHAFGGFGSGQTGATAAFSIEGAPTFNFGGGDDGTAGAAASSPSSGTAGAYANLPAYNFSS